MIIYKYIIIKTKEKGEKSLMKQSNFIENLQVGENVKGIVKNIKPYGAFVDIGYGKVGLVYIEDLSVARIRTPYERLKIGQEINIKVKEINKENGKINLSYKPNTSRKAPTTTKIVVICPGVNFVLYKINCPIKHTIPQNRKAFT